MLPNCRLKLNCKVNIGPLVIEFWLQKINLNIGSLVYDPAPCNYDGVEHPTGSGSILADDVLLLNRVVTCVLDTILIENSSE